MSALLQLLELPIKTVFDGLVRASIQGGVFILLVWVVCRLWPRLPASVRCTLWWLASLKLVVAFLFIDPLPIPVLEPPESAPAATAPVSTVQSTSDAALTAVREFRQQWLPLPAAKAEAGLEWSTLAVGVWTAILALLLAALAHRLRKISGIAGRAVAAPRQVQELAARLCESLELSRTPSVRLSEEADTPLVLGFRRPVVLLPAGSFAALCPDEQRMALCHELLHVRRKDLWLAYVPALAERLFFFHPLAHLAVREYQLTREAACDAAVIRTLDARPGDYGRLLLALGVSRVRLHLAAAGSPSSYSKLKRRITMLRDISDHSSGLRASSWTAILLAALAITPLTFVARSEDRQQAAKPAPASQPAMSPTSAIAPVPAVVPAVPAQAAPSPARERKRRDNHLNYVLLLNENHTMMSGSSEDTDRAKSFQKGNEQLLWFRRGGREYLVRDPVLLQQVQEVYRPLHEIGGDQAKIGAKQAELGGRQAELGKKQAALGGKQAEIGAKQAQIGARQAAFAARTAGKERPDRDELESGRRQLELEMQQLDRQMQELSAQMNTFNSPMGELSKEMGSLSQEMNVLSRKMQEASAKAEAQMSDLLDRAISSGAAKEVK